MSADSTLHQPRKSHGKTRPIWPHSICRFANRVPLIFILSRTTHAHFNGLWVDIFTPSVQASGSQGAIQMFEGDKLLPVYWEIADILAATV